MIIRLSILLAQSGVAIAADGIRWRNAVTTDNGHNYDLLLTDGIVQIQSTKPIVVRDLKDPKVLHVTVNDDPGSRKLLKQFSNPKKFAFISKTPGNPERNQESTFNLNLNNTAGLTALKMALAASTVAFPDEVADFFKARLDLLGNSESSRVESIVFDHRVHAHLDESRNPLCHTIYLEEQEGTIHGLVQFFGCFQAYVTLSDKASRFYSNALLATLDPTTGEEKFREIARLNISKWSGNDKADQLSPIKKFNSYARRRGATNDVLDVSSVSSEDGVERRAKTSIPGFTWTGDFPGRRK